MFPVRSLELVFVGLLAVILVWWVGLDLKAYTRHRPFLPSGAVDLIDEPHPGVGGLECFFAPWGVVFLEGVDRTEGRVGSNYRHGLGLMTQVSLRPGSPGVAVRLHLQLDLPAAVGPATIRLDDQVIDVLPGRPELASRDYDLVLHGGDNRLRFEFAACNHHGTIVARDDTRPLAGTFHALWIALR